MTNRIIHGSCPEALADIPDNSVDLCFTSPPYHLRRSYSPGDLLGEIGQEPTVDEHIDAMMLVFSECERVLKPTGSLWVNYGDGIDERTRSMKLIPQRLAVAIADRLGMLVIQDTIWAREDGFPAKANPKRFNKKHEYVTGFAKTVDWFFDVDAVRVPMKTPEDKRQRFSTGPGGTGSTGAGPAGGNGVRPLLEGFTPVDPRLADKTIRNAENYTQKIQAYNGATETFKRTVEGVVEKRAFKWNPLGAVPGDVLTVNGSDGVEHPAPFPKALVRPFVQGFCPRGGTVLDPFAGSGTTCLVAAEEGRSFIGVERSAVFVKEATDRLAHWMGNRRTSLLEDA